MALRDGYAIVALTLYLAGCGQALASQTDAAGNSPQETTGPITEASPPINPQYDGYLPVLKKTIADHLRYPPKAQVDKQEGDVVVRVNMNRDGTILAVEIVQKSGKVPLDFEARNVFERIVRFPAGPDNVYPDAKAFTFTLPIQFRLH